MRSCEVCGQHTTGQESHCRICETPLPPLPRTGGAGCGLVVLLFLVALGVGAFIGWLIWGAPWTSAMPGPPIGSCVTATQYDLDTRGPRDLTDEVTPCTSPLARLEFVADPDDCVDDCTTIDWSDDTSVTARVLPFAGMCFPAYLLPPGSDARATAWVSEIVPCDAGVEPPSWVVDVRDEIATEREIDPESLELVRMIVVDLGPEVLCSEEQLRWNWQSSDGTTGLCAEEWGPWG